MAIKHFKHKTKSFGDLDYWIAEWLKSDRRASENTGIAYKKDVADFLKKADKGFNKVTIADILDYQSSLPGKPATKARKMAAIRSFYRFLNNREVINPPLNIDRLESPKIKRAVSRDKLLTEKEVKAMIDAAEADPAGQVFVRLLYLTAARVSEALSLRWRDLTALDDGASAYITGKGDKQRSAFIPATLWADLQAMKGEATDADLLFPSLNPYKAWTLVRKLAKAAKIDKKVSPHSFRHAHISHALQHGATVAELRDQAGHANISTTSLYAHASGERATATRLKVR